MVDVDVVVVIVSFESLRIFGDGKIRMIERRDKNNNTNRNTCNFSGLLPVYLWRCFYFLCRGFC